MSSTPSQTLSAFTPLQGGFSEAIAPGPRLVTLSAGGATWWEDDHAVTAELPPNTRVNGARWTPDGKALRVGLGTLDLATRTWRAESTLAAVDAPGPRGDRPVREIAWLPDTRHVAVLIEKRTPDQRTTEVAIVSVVDGRERGRREIANASQLAAAQDRILVAAAQPVLLDLDANVVAQPALPASLARVREGSGMFAAIGAAGAVALVRPGDGAVLATWDGHAVDALPLAKGLVTIDLEGTVRVGCLDGTTIRSVSEVASGVGAAVIQLVDNQIVVAGAGATPVRKATFSNPCP